MNGPLVSFSRLLSEQKNNITSMKLFLTAIATITFFTAAHSQAQYQIVKDENHPEQKYVVGIINKYLVQNDTAYSKWYNSSMSYYTPDTSTLAAFAKAKTGIQFVIFGGTWCEDTQFILPKFFKLQEMSGVPDNSISFFGVNRAKKSLSSIADALGVINVPTIIVMKDGKEAGRVMEYGKTGKWDKELADIIKAVQ
jgi:thiol-disulfide isomerase/thioredoxin